MNYWEEMRVIGESYIERVRHTSASLPTEEAKSAIFVKIAELENLMKKAAAFKNEDLIDGVLQEMLQLEKYLITVTTAEYKQKAD